MHIFSLHVPMCVHVFVKLFCLLLILTFSSVLCYHDAAVNSAVGRRLLASTNRATEEEMAKALLEDLEIINSPAI
jgi:hypothetical protein